MNAVKARDQYQIALRLLSELRAVPFDSERSPAKLAQLSGLVYSIRSISKSIADKDSNAVWHQRSAALHKDLVALTYQLAQGNENGGQSWDGLVGVLYIAAEAVEKLEQEKEALLDRLAAETKHRQQLERTLQEQLLSRDAVAKEILELRTKFVVQQQDFQRRDADARDLVRRLQHAVKERDALNTEKEFLDEKNSHNMQILERQGQAISQLMQQVEDNTKQKEEALASLLRINEDNHTLRVNLGQHAQVIENLIEINAEMMEAANSYSLLHEQRRLIPQEKENPGHGETVAATRTDLVDDLVDAPPPDPAREGMVAQKSELLEEAIAVAAEHNSSFAGDERAQVEQDVNSPEKPRRREVRWTSDMLPLSFKDITDLKTSTPDESVVFDSAPGSSGLLGKLGGVRGRARGFLSFVAGADLAGSVHPNV